MCGRARSPFSVHGLAENFPTAALTPVGTDFQKRAVPALPSPLYHHFVTIKEPPSRLWVQTRVTSSNTLWFGVENVVVQQR